MKKHTVTLLLALMTLFGLSTIHAQVQPFIGLDVRQKLDFSHMRSPQGLFPTYSSAMLTEGGLTLGVDWKKSGLGVQLEVRRAIHNGRFVIKNNPNYAIYSDGARLDFRTTGVFVPAFLTWKKGFGASEKWGLQTKIGAGLLFIDPSTDGLTSGTLQSDVTGTVSDFDWESANFDQRFDSWMIEAGIGLFWTPITNIMFTANLFTTQSVNPIAYKQIAYEDGNSRGGFVDLFTSGQSLGLQVGVRYIFAKK